MLNSAEEMSDENLVDFTVQMMDYFILEVEREVGEVRTSILNYKVHDGVSDRGGAILVEDGENISLYREEFERRLFSLFKESEWVKILTVGYWLHKCVNTLVKIRQIQLNPGITLSKYDLWREGVVEAVSWRIVTDRLFNNSKNEEDFWVQGDTPFLMAAVFDSNLYRRAILDRMGQLGSIYFYTLESLNLESEFSMEFCKSFNVCQEIKEAITRGSGRNRNSGYEQFVNPAVGIVATQRLSPVPTVQSEPLEDEVLLKHANLGY